MSNMDEAVVVDIKAVVLRGGVVLAVAALGADVDVTPPPVPAFESLAL